MNNINSNCLTIFIVFTFNFQQVYPQLLNILSTIPITSHSGPQRVSDIDGKVLHYPGSRSKRWSNNYMGGSSDWNGLLIKSGIFNEYDKNSIVNTHNTLRALLPSTNMRMLYWSEELAVSAQKHANTCDFRHSRGRRNVGENIWASPWGNWSDAVPRWFNEVYDPNCKCQHAYKHCCGHYVQTVWADTNLVGCGFAQCRDVQGVFGRGHHYVFVCHYNPQGNLYYVTGNGGMYTIPAFKWDVNGKGRCSECPSDAPDCYNGLCYKAKPNEINYTNNINTTSTIINSDISTTTITTTTVTLDPENENDREIEEESTTELTTISSPPPFFNGRQFRKNRIRSNSNNREYYRRRNNENMIRRF
ncbi:CAP domain-containing protein [Strongyloides ratti]|uniref:CAP domain-containing protein n=1 Tax=Strongyloides ratti TaxID=34506 RepID=A0A090LGY9_STRRB|nr:CAP domain-containing protein [Strongyloides ratti]CEF67398.1 CAP domain-containing protein [Strongyloides ratti]